jgi:hypothetical protein
MTGSVGAAGEYHVITLVYVETDTHNPSFEVIHEYHDSVLSWDIV